MRIGTRADDNCLNTLVIENATMILKNGWDIQLGPQPFGCFHIDVRDRDQHRTRDAMSEVFRMHPADPAGADYANKH
jgi:hypothetical protein